MRHPGVNKRAIDGVLVAHFTQSQAARREIEGIVVYVTIYDGVGLAGLAALNDVIIHLVTFNVIAIR